MYQQKLSILNNREKNIEKNEYSLRDLQEKSKRFNTYIIRVHEEQKKEFHAEKYYFREVTVLKHSKFSEISNLYILEADKPPNKSHTHPDSA